MHQAPLSVVDTISNPSNKFDHHGELEASVHHRRYVDDHERTNDIDSIYHNMDSSSSFCMFRSGGYMTVEGCIQRLARQIAAGCFDKVVSVSGSSNNFTVVVETGLSQAEIYKRNRPL